jgi:carbonic anhydrase
MSVIHLSMSKFPKKLLDGYSDFMSGHYQDERDRYHELAQKGQKPETLIIACCDSRAAPETIFNTLPGELFVVRNVANLVPVFSPTDEGQHGTSAALEFGIVALKIKNIIVMGHGRCGGINAALNPLSEPLAPGDFIGKWLDILKPNAKKANEVSDISDEDRQTYLERLSVHQSISNLRSFPYIEALEKENNLNLYGAWFDIKTGELWVLDDESGEFIQAAV